MEKFAQYIKSIEIESLWSNRRHIKWQLRPDVNILSGSNGVGKSTIINRSASHLKVMRDGQVTRNPEEGVNITFYPEDATRITFDLISSVDRPVLSSELLEKISGVNVRTELDWQLYHLQRRYLNYQVNVGNRIISLLTSGNPDDQRLATELTKPKKMFQDLIDDLFAPTGKTIVRDSNEIFFNQYGEQLSPYILSSGEKQLLVIMLTALVMECRPGVLFMDEPEISLHIEWQQRLITLIRTLNPNVQIILCTHSPAIIMDGWMDAVTEIEDIIEAQ
ncbi:MAG: ATP-binding protein [Bacteroidaceae bacterium]|nr:ATP-binding protein [Bacteroidaceae bacterium]MBQ5731507.1 ATP-binding protein [Bacteroidaceae bacterium]